jgi:signal transduction histidine kinase/CheY-like chemotaxis protein
LESVPAGEREVISLQEPIASTFIVIALDPAQCPRMFHAGRAHDFSLRRIVSPFPNTALAPLGTGSTVYVLIQDAKAIRPWIRLTSELEFQKVTLFVWMFLAAITAVLMLVIVVVMSLSSRSRTVMAYCTYVAAFMLWMMQNYGVGFAWFPSLFPPSTFAKFQALAVAVVVGSIGWTIIEFLNLRGRYRSLFAAPLVTSVVCFMASAWWPATYRMASLALGLAALISIVLLVTRLRDTDIAVRIFALGLGATVVGGGTQALSIVFAETGGSWLAVYSFTIGSFIQAMLWMLAISTRTRTERQRLLSWREGELENKVAQATRELLSKKEIAEDATRAKSDFLAAASHDLRQPSHALGLLVSRMGQFSMQPDMRAVHESLQACVGAIQDLLDDLMDYTRLDSGSQEILQRPISLSDLQAHLVETLAPMAAAKGLRLRLRPTELWAVSDPTLLRRLVMNLAQNAIRYTPQGTVLVTCRPTNNRANVRIDVWDSGVGIAAEQHTLIFKEFFQVGNPGRDRNKGIGLGLSIVKRGAEILGYSIALRSAPGCGSRFSIELPACEPQHVSVQAPIDAPMVSPTDLNGVDLLIVEDDALSGHALQELMTTWGCQVRTASTPTQAVALLQERVPNIIVSDYRLGDAENGVELIARMRALAGQDIPACVISGDLDGRLVTEVNRLGLRLLHKPVRPAKLRSLIRQLNMRSESHSQSTAASE